MKLSLFLALTSASMAVTPIVNLPPLDDYSPHTHSAGMLGWTFTVHSTVTVTGVGWFDYGKDGLLSSVQVGLWRDTSVSGWWDPSSIPETIWTGSVASNDPLHGEFRVLLLQQEITLSPGRYQIGGLNNGIDPGSFVSTDMYDPVSTDSVAVGSLFFSEPMNSIGRTDFGPLDGYSMALASGLEMGPMLFVVPEPSSLMIGTLGMLVLLRRRKTAF